MCAHTYIYVYAHIHIHEADFLTFDAMRQVTYTHTHTHIYICVCVHTHIFPPPHTRTQTNTHTLSLSQASQCMGRVIRSKTDYGIMVLADQRYSRADKRNKLPNWIRKYIKDTHLNMSTDMCVSQSKEFLSRVSRKESWQDQVGTILLSIDDIQGGGISRPPDVLPRPPVRPSIPERAAALAEKTAKTTAKALDGAGSRAMKRVRTEEEGSGSAVAPSDCYEDRD
jgi:Helicase C-terminal domain